MIESFASFMLSKIGNEFLLLKIVVKEVGSNFLLNLENTFFKPYDLGT